VAILIMLLTISIYVVLHIRKYNNIPSPIPDHVEWLMDIAYLPYWTEFQLRCCFSVKINI
jgi:hypothetical protein